MKKRFRVALSFTSSKREFVADMAGILANRLGVDSVLYDGYHQAEFARADLGSYLARLYQEDSDLVVVVLGRDFEKKTWCGLEWSAIYGLLRTREQSNVMLMRFDRVEGQGLFGLAGFIDLDDKTSQEAATLVLERLALDQGRDVTFHGSEMAPPLHEWPDEAPPIDWPVANQDEARRLFGRLVTREAPFRLLLVHGKSETGKSHLARQFLRNALKIRNLRSAKFDFKGVADIDDEIWSFADRLGVARPVGGTGVSSQLAQILTSLEAAAQPTLLILDTYEAAGETDLWIQRELFATLRRMQWLRVIILGQRVPDMTPDLSTILPFASIELHAPSAEDWFAYAKRTKDDPAITLDFIRAVHALTNGRASVIAQVAGPT